MKLKDLEIFNFILDDSNLRAEETLFADDAISKTNDGKAFLANTLTENKTTSILEKLKK